MKTPIRIAVVALGRAGWNIHVEQLRQRQDFTIVDVADPDPARREEAAAALNCGTHSEIDALLAKTTAELVVVATPNTLHESDAIKVMESGRHCIVEKPMSADHAAALRMIEVSKKTGKKLFVHHQRRFLNEFRFLREVIDSGILGKIFQIRLCWANFARRNDWQTLRKNNGGLLNNHGPHALDQVLNLVDTKVETLVADLQLVKDAGDCEDHFSLFMKTADGVSIDLTCTTACAQPLPRIMLLGANGTLSANDDKTAKLRYYDPTKVAKLEVIEGAAKDRKYGTGETLPWQEEEREMKPSQEGGNFYDNVVAVLTEGAPMGVTPESAAEVGRIMEWAHKTATIRRT
jgi:scyllo-inositol 2-dehydrogenase (NADP+)